MSTDASLPAAAAFRRAFSVAAFATAVACTSVTATEATFDETTWRVTAINGQVTPASGDYRISFEDGRIGGRFGCNQFRGPYQVGGDTMVAGDIASTLMGCPEPAATHEAQGFAVLGQPMRISWNSGKRLTLGNSAGAIALERIGPT